MSDRSREHRQRRKAVQAQLRERYEEQRTRAAREAEQQRRQERERIDLERKCERAQRLEEERRQRVAEEKRRREALAAAQLQHDLYQAECLHLDLGSFRELQGARQRLLALLKEYAQRRERELYQAEREARIAYEREAEGSVRRPARFGGRNIGVLALMLALACGVNEGGGERF